jgi:lysophospholipase L1-like esterase
MLCLAVPIELIFGDWFSSESITMLNVGSNTIEVGASPLYPPGRMITYSRDRYGFRAGSSDASKVDVLVVGGSTTSERLTDDSDLWTVQLQHLLAQAGCQLGIANAGIDGYSTYAHILSFDEWFNRIPGLKPKFVLVYAGVNDAIIDPITPPRMESQKFQSWRRRLGHYIAARSAIRRLVVTAHAWWEARQAGLLLGQHQVTPQMAWEPAEPPTDLAAVTAAKSVAYRQRLQRLDSQIRELGAVPIYVTQFRVDGREMGGQWQRMSGSDGALQTATLMAINHTTLEFCRDSGETCVDLADEIHFQPGDFYDYVHTTLAGTARIARFLAPKLDPILCPARQS